MSGPKVVRVVTREEKVATSEALLRRLDRAIASWDSTLRKLGVADEEARASMTARFEAFEALLRADKFSEMQRDVLAEIAFVEGDEDRRRVKATEARAVMLTRGRQLMRNAAALLEDLRTRGVSIDEPMAARLVEIASGQLVGTAAEAGLSQTFRDTTTKGVRASLTDSQREIAARMVGANQGQDFESWMTAHSDADESRIGNLVRRLAELASYLGDGEVTVFGERLEALRQGGEDAGKNLRVDSLVLDLSSAISKAKADAAMVKEGCDVVAEMATFEGESESEFQSIAVDLTDALDRSEVAKLPTLVARGKAALAAAVIWQAAAARRTAVLGGLKALGYDVREGMSTAWQVKGRLVVRRPGEPGYGVEISSAASGERIQVRAVAFSASRDTSRDASVETEWCGDFGKLQKMFAKAGGGLDIEKANPIGALPLKAVDLGEQTADTPTSSRARS